MDVIVDKPSPVGEPPSGTGELLPPKDVEVEDFTVPRQALHTFMEIFTLVVVGIVAVHWTYRHNHGYWLLYFGQHGPLAESCLISLLGMITLWMRAALFPPRPFLSPGTSDANPERAQPLRNAGRSIDSFLRRNRWTSWYPHSSASVYLSYLSGSVTTSDQNDERENLNRLAGNINKFVLVVLLIAASLMYSNIQSSIQVGRVHREWIAISLLLVAGLLYSASKRASSGGVIYTDKAKTSAVAMQLAKGEFQSQTRGAWAYWSFWLLIALPSVVFYCYKTVPLYRWAVPIPYFIGWTLPCIILVAWCWEVLWAVVGSYRSTRIKMMPGIGNLYWLHKALGDDTMPLIWSLGAFSFFLVGFFGDFYVDITKYLYFIAVTLILSVALLPWLWAHAWAEGIIRVPLNEREKDLAECYISKDEHPENWKDTQKSMEDLLTEISSLKDLLAKFELLQWIKDRQADLLPVTLINLVGPYITGPILNLIHNLTKQ